MINNKVTVENIIKNMENSVMSLTEFRIRVNNKMSFKNLKLILNDLQEEGKIFIGSKGITWIYSSPKHLKLMLKNSLEI